MCPQVAAGWQAFSILINDVNVECRMSNQCRLFKLREEPPQINQAPIEPD